ncbi:MAG: hypothetical protein NTW30_05030 [Candidatus Aenigmarchaeota archaeon]|nr:hypothetical protein [Candidatus Aenigmarchaeota archaeon]
MKLSVPEHTLGALYRYFVQGCQPGGFLTAVINKIPEAYYRADEENLAAYGHILVFIDALKNKADSHESDCYADSISDLDFQDVCGEYMDYVPDVKEF